MNTRSFALAVLIGGAVMALLGNLPLVNLVNCVLCIWVWLGGAVAVMLYRRFTPGTPAVTGGQGAALGAVAGLVGAILGFGVLLLTSAVTTPVMESLARALDIQGEMPFAPSGPGGTVAGALFFLLIDLGLYPLFGALSGLITANSGKRNTPAPA